MKLSSPLARLSLISAVATAWLSSASLAFAQAPSGLYNPATGRLNTDANVAATGLTFVSYFITIWQALITVGAILVIVFFLWGSIEWITSGGDSGKVQKARDRITQAIIGLVILVGSFVIIAFLGSLFFGPDFDVFRMTFPTPDTIRPEGGLPPLPTSLPGQRI